MQTQLWGRRAFPLVVYDKAMLSWSWVQNYSYSIQGYWLYNISNALLVAQKISMHCEVTFLSLKVFICFFFQCGAEVLQLILSEKGRRDQIVRILSEKVCVHIKRVGKWFIWSACSNRDTCRRGGQSLHHHHHTHWNKGSTQRNGLHNQCVCVCGKDGWKQTERKEWQGDIFC